MNKVLKNEYRMWRVQGHRDSINTDVRKVVVSGKQEERKQRVRVEVIVIVSESEKE